MEDAKFVKGKNNIEVKMDHVFKVFIRIPKGTSMMQLRTVSENMRRDYPIVFIPEGYEVIVVNKDGTSKKL
jgi:hypothetical protein